MVINIKVEKLSSTSLVNTMKLMEKEIRMIKQEVIKGHFRLKFIGFKKATKSTQRVLSNLKKELEAK